MNRLINLIKKMSMGYSYVTVWFCLILRKAHVYDA